MLLVHTEVRPGTVVMEVVASRAIHLSAAFSFGLGLLASNNFVSFVNQIGIVFLLVMSRFHLSSCVVYSGSSSLHSSWAIGSGYPNFSINAFPLVVMDGG